MLAGGDTVNNIGKNGLQFSRANIPTEGALIDIPLHVLSAHVVVYTMVATLEQSPKTFNRIGVDAIAGIFPGPMVYDRVRKQLADVGIGAKFIGMEL
jgi:hypothetical protein